MVNESKAPSGRVWPRRHEVGEMLLSAEEIGQRVAELGAAISGDYAGLEPRLIGILKGVAPFMADLMRAITIPVSTDYMAISKYDPTSETTSAVRLLKDLDLSITGKHALLVEDVIDSGRTMEYILENLRGREPASLKVCTLFNKPAQRVVDLPLDYVGFDLPDVFVVGYGLDFEQKYRNLPYLATLRTEVDVQ
ncbi:MAG: hypoxanthine phosphoribosyltransferase [Chloroflexi bacterium B3_Chlor]|nr:MAG: hypoxanthine phosphoribosyltransferase [Chloroflexi bacterium B3_Chlor]